MRRLMRLLLVLLVASCGTTDNTTTRPLPTRQTTMALAVTTTTISPTVKTVPSTTTTTTTTTTTRVPPTTTGAAGRRYAVGELGFCGRDFIEPCVSSLFRAEPLPGSEGAAGSGCTPGTTSLPDGIWFGFVAAKSATSIEFDLACIYFGDPAYVPEDSSEDIRNTNPALRTIAVDPSVPVYEVAPVEVGFVTVPFADWAKNADQLCPGDFCAVWLFVNDAEVTEILEQAVPNN